MQQKIYPFALGLLSLCLVCLAGCASDDSSSYSARADGGSLRTEAVPSADVSKVQAWKDANSLASRSQGSTALVGAGQSMNPVYGENTMLVVHPIEYAKLKLGMTVVYLSSRTGGRVAHRLIAKESRGWRAKGLNNETEDYELVTPENLIGIVYISLVSEGN